MSLTAEICGRWLRFQLFRGCVRCGTVEHTIQLMRWIDLPSEGWYSADLHVHLGQNDPRVLEQLALADDVHLVPAFTYWLRGLEETWHAN